MPGMPARSRRPYTANVGGGSRARGPVQQFQTLRECKEWAESYGCTAEWCVVEDAKGRRVAEYRRDTSCRGERWFRAT